MKDYKNQSDVFFSIYYASIPFDAFKAIDYCCKTIDKDKLSIDDLFNYSNYLSELGPQSMLVYDHSISLMQYKTLNI